MHSSGSALSRLASSWVSESCEEPSRPRTAAHFFFPSDFPDMFAERTVEEGRTPCSQITIWDADFGQQVFNCYQEEKEAGQKRPYQKGKENRKWQRCTLWKSKRYVSSPVISSYTKHSNLILHEREETHCQLFKTLYKKAGSTLDCTHCNLQYE